jgi:hypothetical protein
LAESSIGTGSVGKDLTGSFLHDEYANDNKIKAAFAILKIFFLIFPQV